MSFDPGSRVVLVFDTDKEVTEHLKKNIEMLNKVCSKVEVLTIAQVLNFEDEMVRSTDVSVALSSVKSIVSLKNKKSTLKSKKRYNLYRIWF